MGEDFLSLFFGFMICLFVFWIAQQNIDQNIPPENCFFGYMCTRVHIF